MQAKFEVADVLTRFWDKKQALNPNSAAILGCLFQFS
jgi:hypothetical protein